MDNKLKDRQFIGMGLVVLAGLILAACQPAAVPAAPGGNAYFTAPTSAPVSETAAAVKVSDQSVDGGKVTIAEVDSPGPGWLVIHAEAEGKPGAVLGYSPVTAGANNDVVVSVDDSEATSVMYAMLHIDAGQVGVYEFPGADAPATVNEKMVSPAFNVTGRLSSKDSTASKGSGKDDLYDDSYGVGGTPAVPVTGNGVEIKVSSKDGLGTFLVDEKGMTLYLFTKDTPGVSNCSGSCLTAWPPLLTNGEPRADDGVTGKLDTITRDDGSLQVTYNDMPLYYYVTDVKPGDTTGQDVGGVWFVVAP